MPKAGLLDPVAAPMAVPARLVAVAVVAAAEPALVVPAAMPVRGRRMDKPNCLPK
jgi:hypothetical protein